MKKYNTWEEYLKSDQESYLDPENGADEDVREKFGSVRISGKSDIRAYYAEGVDDDGISTGLIAIYADADLESVKNDVRAKNTTTRLHLRLTYANGKTLTQLVNYIRVENGKLSYTTDRQSHPIFQQPVEIPMENLTAFELNAVECYGWEPVIKGEEG